ncbi:hypothetical protein FRC18_001785 [Serendipita sp. 400]|nr:hypothetical protein FRC18_001785 [Serendipita sp. 400]
MTPSATTAPFAFSLFFTSSNAGSHAAIADNGHQSKPTMIADGYTVLSAHNTYTAHTTTGIHQPTTSSLDASSQRGMSSENRAKTGETSANDEFIVVEVSSPSKGVHHDGLGTNGTEAETYWLIGDGESVSMILGLLINAKSSSQGNQSCGMLKYTLLHVNSTIGYSNIHQWRDSPLIALASKASDAFLQPNATLEGGGKDTVVHPPEQELHSPLLHCLNQTITTAFKSEETTIGALGVAGIVLFVVLTFACALLCCLSRCIKDGTLRIRIGRASRRDYMDYGCEGPPGSYHLDSMGLPPLNDPSQIPPGMPLPTPSVVRQHVPRRDYVSRRSLTPAPPATGSNDAPTSTVSNVPQVQIPAVAHVHET